MSLESHARVETDPRPSLHLVTLVAGAVLVSLGVTGCWLSHERDPLIGLPDGTVIGPDGQIIYPDGGPPDGGTDGGTDGGFDAGPDTPPPPPTPPDPSTCRIEPTIFAFDDPVMEIRWPDGPMAHSSSVHVCSTPVVIDPDPNDGVQQTVIAFPSYATLRGDERGIMRIWNPHTHETVSYPPDESELGVMEATGNLAAADLDGDGDVEFLGMGIYSGTYAVHHDGTLFWESPFPTVRDRGDMFERTIGTAITLADLEGDGTVEVIAGRNVLEGLTGDRRWVGDSSLTTRGTNNFLGPISCVADLDGDGFQEVIAGRTAFHHDGTIYWNNEALGDGFCAVADMYPSTPGPEVVLTSRGYFYILNGNTGAILYTRIIEGRGTDGIGGAPTVADFDGDGRPEIGIAHGGAYGVYDLDCAATPRPASCVANGLLWTQPTGDESSSGTGSSVFDFNGDRHAEVVYNDQYFFRVYDGNTGRPLFEQRNSSRTRTENPVIADVDDDGDAEIVFSANAEAFFIRDFWTDPGVEIWGDAHGRWVGARRIWNQHAYHITNINEDGSIASPESPSWLTLNAYRQNLREGNDLDVLVVPDLWGGHGSYECLGEGRIRITVTVANYGLERAGAGIVVGLYRGSVSEENRVDQTTTTRTLEPNGDSVEVTFDVTLEGDVVSYYAVLDDPAITGTGGAVNECREGNNEVLIWRPQCGG
ncbi:MAG: hypothetical protein AB7S26_09410 [Sandaracinaceae bacterium]